MPEPLAAQPSGRSRRAPRVPRLVGRAGWNLGDQILSAASNVALSVVAARSLDAHDFGAFSIAFVIFMIAAAVTKAAVGQPLQIRHSAQTPQQMSGTASRGLGAALSIGLLIGLGCLVTALGFGGSLGTALVTLAVGMPWLMMQDTCRMVFFAQGRAASAALIDGVWTVLQFAFLFALFATGTTGVGALVGAWAAAAAVSSLVGFSLLKARPRIRATRRWFQGQRDLVGYLLAEYVVGLGAAHLALLLAGAIASAADVGALRAAQVVLGPLNILGSAAFAFAIPEIARRPHLTARDRLRASYGLSGLMAVAAAIYCSLVLLCPDSVGLFLFRDTWAGAQTTLLPMSVAAVVLSAGSGPGAMLYGMGLARETFRLHAFKAPLLIVLVFILTSRSGASGTAIALATCELLLLPAWFWVLHRHVHRGPRQSPDQPIDSPDPVTPAAAPPPGGPPGADPRDLDPKPHERPTDAD